MIEYVLYGVSALFIGGTLLFAIGYFTEHRSTNTRLNKRQLKNKLLK